MMNEDFYVKINAERIIKALDNNPEIDLANPDFFTRDLLASALEARRGDGFVLCGKRVAGFVYYWVNGGDSNEK